MKKLALSLLSFIALSISFSIHAQDALSDRPSPPASVQATLLGNANISIAYSSPAVKGRKIWDGLVPYAKVWRTGANEATIFETDKAIMVNGQKLPAGKYSIFTVPGEKEWIFIFNKAWDQWGLFSYDTSKDALRVTAVPVKSSAFNERMQFSISDNILSLLWENLRVDLSLQ